ncbi:MAG TPA: OadG family transporter subunit [Bacteroidales bacterium]|jgi:Na+-transporting methylmalonyl-CoA/oxaloacetate decarboxylase gamma subunit|nr:OadG family transporter subunit [Bacteroidales bacterium]
MNEDLISALKLTAMGMGAIFTVVLVIYFAVRLMLKFTGRKRQSADKAQ